LALIGFGDATYITVKHFQGIIPPCSIEGCEVVLTSSYSEILGIPVSLFGMIFYFTILLSLFIYFDSKKEIFLKIPLVISVVGFVGSLYFISIMAFVLKAFCQYCAVSAFSSISIFIVSVYIFYKNYAKSE
jgi:uncharacterized membrane protein